MFDPRPALEPIAGLAARVVGIAQDLFALLTASDPEGHGELGQFLVHHCLLDRHQIAAGRGTGGGLSLGMQGAQLAGDAVGEAGPERVGSAAALVG